MKKLLAMPFLLSTAIYASPPQPVIGCQAHYYCPSIVYSVEAYPICTAAEKNHCFDMSSIQKISYGSKIIKKKMWMRLCWNKDVAPFFNPSTYKIYGQLNPPMPPSYNENVFVGAKIWNGKVTCLYGPVPTFQDEEITMSEMKPSGGDWTTQHGGMQCQMARYQLTDPDPRKCPMIMTTN